MRLNDCFTEKMKTWGRCVTFYKSNEHPTIIDTNIIDVLTPIEQAYFEHQDIFIYFKGDNANDIKIAFASYEHEILFNSWDEFKRFCESELKAFCASYASGIISHKDFTNALEY